MVFENLTLFELHLEGARVGPSFGDDEAEEDEAVAADSGGSRAGPLLAFLALLAVGAAVGYRRFGGSGGAGEGEDGEQITIEAATDR